MERIIKSTTKHIKTDPSDIRYIENNLTVKAHLWNNCNYPFRQMISIKMITTGVSKVKEIIDKYKKLNIGCKSDEWYPPIKINWKGYELIVKKVASSVRIDELVCYVINRPNKEQSQDVPTNYISGYQLHNIVCAMIKNKDKQVQLINAIESYANHSISLAANK